MEIMPEEMRDDYWMAEMASVVGELLDAARPQLAYSRFGDVEFRKQDCVIDGRNLHCGGRMVSLLSRCDSWYIFVATLGNGISDLYKRYDEEGEFLKSYWVDSAANIWLDKLVLQWRRSLMEGEGEGCGSTFPISPGCCQWDIAEQKELLSLIDAGAIGVTLSESAVMRPLKSLSGLVGIGKKIPFMEDECLYCGKKDCVYSQLRRKKG